MSQQRPKAGMMSIPRVQHLCLLWRNVMFLNDITKLLACFPFERYCGAVVLKQSSWPAAKPLNHLYAFEIKANLQELHQLSCLFQTARRNVCLYSNSAQRKKVEKLHRGNRLVHHNREILIVTNSSGISTDFRKIRVLQYTTTQPLKKSAKKLGKTISNNSWRWRIDLLEA